MKKILKTLLSLIVLVHGYPVMGAGILKRSTNNHKETNEILLGCEIGPGKCSLENGYCETKNGETGRCISYEKFDNKFYCECINACTKEVDVICHKKCINVGYSQGICKDQIKCPNKASTLTITDDMPIECCCN